MYPHRIRLRGPWECTEKNSSANPRRVTVPCQLRDIGLTHFSGEVCFSRQFGYPGQIDSYERVWLTFADIKDMASISLNGSAVGTTAGPCEFDVTTLLKPHNRLEILLQA